MESNCVIQRACAEHLKFFHSSEKGNTSKIHNYFKVSALLHNSFYRAFYRVFLGSALRSKDPMGAVQYDALSLVHAAEISFFFFFNIAAHLQVFWSFHKVSINILQMFQKFNQSVIQQYKISRIISLPEKQNWV